MRERRFRASKLAKLDTIRAIVLNSDDAKLREFALIENIQRDELNSIELAFAYSELIRIHQITHEELSAKINKSRTHITNTIRLLQLSKTTQNALIDGKISTGHAKVLVGLDEKTQQLIVNTIIGQKLSVREVETMIKNLKNKEEVQKVSAKQINYNFSTVEAKFNEIGFKTKSSGNKLTIEFKNEQQIEELLAKLSKNH